MPKCIYQGNNITKEFHQQVILVVPLRSDHVRRVLEVVLNQSSRQEAEVDPVPPLQARELALVRVLASLRRKQPKLKQPVAKIFASRACLATRVLLVEVIVNRDVEVTHNDVLGRRVEVDRQGAEEDP